MSEHTRTLSFTTAAQRKFFPRIHEGLVNGSNVVRNLDLKEKNPKASEDLWARRGPSPRIIRKIKAIGVPGKEFLDDDKTLPIYVLETLGATLVLTEEEFKYACRCLRSAQWNAAVEDEIDDVIVFFERAVPDQVPA